MALVVKKLPANAGDPGDVSLIPGWERSPGGGCGNPLQYSCLENPMDIEEPVGLKSMGSQRVRYDRSDLAHTEKERVSHANSGEKAISGEGTAGMKASRWERAWHVPETEKTGLTSGRVT